ncbi:MAG: AraC family transcriptional regulator [Lachnospiraceae bacterium]|nr:AraC family transcriptional regulator [Lachnospiraceae bacterium]
MIEQSLPEGRYDDHAFLDYERSNDFSLYEIGNFACPPLYSYGPVARTRDIFHFVFAGKGKLVIRNKEFNVDTMQGFLIPAKERAFYIADKDEPWSYFWLHVGGSRLPDIWKKAGINADSPIFISDAKKSPLYDLYNMLNAGRDRELYCMSKLYEIMDHITSTSIHRDTSHSNTGIDHVHRIIRIIQLKYSEPITIAQIADLCGLNRSYMSRLFSNATGNSIQGYLIKYRMKKAMQLLKETDDTVQNIAYLVGYSDIFTFSKAFKKISGQSPTDYRVSMSSK